MRVAQDALSNSVGHGRPATISLRSGPDQRGKRPGVFVEIEDDGGGTPDFSHGGGGLRNMRERARLLGGEIEIAEAAEGTRVRLWLPCEIPPGGTLEPTATSP
jgi:two-component system sensor histidine kinase UhpB